MVSHGVDDASMNPVPVPADVCVGSQASQGLHENFTEVSCRRDRLVFCIKGGSRLFFFLALFQALPGHDAFVEVSELRGGMIRAGGSRFFVYVIAGCTTHAHAERQKEKRPMQKIHEPGRHCSYAKQVEVIDVLKTT